MKKLIKLFDPIIGNDELDILTKTLKSKFWADGSGSNQVKQFEEKFQKIIKSDSNVAVNSGTSALYLALSMEDIKNKEVILPSLSFGASSTTKSLGSKIAPYFTVLLLSIFSLPFGASSPVVVILATSPRLTPL